MIPWEPADPSDLQHDLQEYLNARYRVCEIKMFDTGEDEIRFHLDLQVTFGKTEMEGQNPTPRAVERLDIDLEEYLGRRYEVNSIEVEDAGYLLDVWDDPKRKIRKRRQQKGGN